MSEWREAWVERQRAGGEGCPGEAALVELTLGEGEQTARRALLEHVVGCRRCSALTRDLAALHAAAQGEPVATRDRRRGPGRGALLLVAAAVITVCAILSWPLLRPLDTGAPPRGLRGGVVSVAAADSPADGASLDGVPSRLAWEAVADADAYTITLLDAEATTLWRGRTAGATSVELSDQVRATLGPGIYYWRVEARVGVQRVGSALHRFAVAP